MNNYFKILLTGLLLTGSCLTTRAQEQPVTKASFTCIDLNNPGLEKVKQQVAAGSYDAAAAALLTYYRNRTGMLRPNFDLEGLKQSSGKKLNREVQEAADNALLHRFKPHKAYPTPAFLMKFLDAYAQQADYVLANYTRMANIACLRRNI